MDGLTGNPANRITINYYFVRFDSRGLDEIGTLDFNDPQSAADVRKRINLAIDRAKTFLRSAPAHAQATIVYRSNAVATVTRRRAKRYTKTIKLLTSDLPA